MTKTTRTPRHMGTTPVPVEQVAQSILLLRGKRVILDRELAAIYGVPTGRLNEAVKRNIERFPEDFMFQLTRGEREVLDVLAAAAVQDRRLRSWKFGF